MEEKAKRNRVVLTFNKKLEIIKSIDAGSLYTVIAEKYSTCNAQLTVANIEKDASKVGEMKKSIEIGFRKATSKTMKISKYQKDG